MDGNNNQNDNEPPLAVEEPIGEKIPLITVTEEKPFIRSEIKRSDFNIIGEKTEDFRSRFFPEASDKQWNSWRWQIQNSYTQFSKLSEVIDLSSISDLGNLSKSRKLPLRITPYYASLLHNKNPESAIAKTVIPTKFELVLSEGEESDPLHEDSMCPVPNLVHRYPDRTLLLSTRILFRILQVLVPGPTMVLKDKKHYGTKAWLDSIEYIKNNPSIRDVIISGGDPLTMNDRHLEFLVASLHAIPHVEIIRIGTKVPMVLPQRITKNLVKMLKKYQPLFMSIHVTHPDEITPEVSEALSRLADAGIVLGSQTVLLKGVNDSVDVMKTLMLKLVKNRVRPYYIYQCDPIPGSAHFRTPVSKGLEIIQGLRGFISGYAIPHYVIDAPGGGGKVPILPEYYQGREGDYVIIKNFEGNLYKYYDPIS